MRKIKVVICAGTTCHVLGGSQLLVLEDYLSSSLKSKIEIEGSTCMDLCKDRANGKPPFVRVGSHVISEATPGKVIDYLLKIMPEEK